MQLLRLLLLGIYGFVGGVFAFFSCLSVAFFDKNHIILSSYTTANAIVIALLSWATFRLLRDRKPGDFFLALSLFAWGFGQTAIYRAIFVPGSPDKTDLTNALIFGIPALLVGLYALPRTKGLKSAPASTIDR